MDWLKRHWVDALMVGLIVTVVGGVLTLLLRGSGFGASPPSVTAAQPLQPAPSSRTATPAPSSRTAPSASSSQPAPTIAPPAAAPPAKPVEIPTIPAIATAPPSSAPAPTAARSVQPSAAQPSAPPIKRLQPATAQREPLNYARADFLRNYRVAIATYSSATRAQSSAARLRALGYPAQAFSSGSGFIVVAGPYARQSSARSAFNKLRAQGYSDAVLYSPNGDRERSAAAKPAPTAPAPSGGGSSPAQLDPGLSYLQVGAFKTVKSALPLLERLKGSGFKTLLRSASDGYTRVLVGPFSAALLANAKQNLSEQGLTPFAVKQ